MDMLATTNAHPVQNPIVLRRSDSVNFTSFFMVSGHFSSVDGQQYKR